MKQSSKFGVIWPYVKYINQTVTYTNQIVTLVESDATQIIADEWKAEQAAVV